MDDYEKSKPHRMDLQISRCLHSEMSAQGAVSRTAPTLGRGVPEARLAEGVEDRGGAFDARPRAHAAVDPAKIRGVAGRRIHQRQERDPLGPGLWGAQAQLHGIAFLGPRVLREHRRSGRRGHCKALLAAHEVLLREFNGFEKRVRQQARQDKRVRLVTSAPGVGPIVGLTYVAAIDDPARFKSSKQVGPHFGLTPKRYQSGETDFFALGALTGASWRSSPRRLSSRKFGRKLSQAFPDNGAGECRGGRLDKINC